MVQLVDHQPPHFHAKIRGEWEIRVFFLLSGAEDLSYEMEWGSDPSRSDRMRYWTKCSLIEQSYLRNGRRNYLPAKDDGAEIEFNVVQCDTDSHAIASSPGIKVLAAPRDLSDHVQNLFVLCSATQLRLFQTSPCGRSAASAARLVGAPECRSVVAAADARTRESTHTAKRAARRGGDVPRSVMRAWTRGAQHQLIAKATIAGDSCSSSQCAATTYEIAFNDVPALAAIPHAERQEFKVTRTGVFSTGPRQTPTLTSTRSATQSILSIGRRPGSRRRLTTTNTERLLQFCPRKMDPAVRPRRLV